MVLNHHHHPCLKNIVPKTEKILQFAWYAEIVCYLVFIIVGSYYIKILHSQCGTGFVNCHVQIVKVLLVVVTCNMQFGMQVIPAQWQYGFALIYWHNGKVE